MRRHSITTLCASASVAALLCAGQATAAPAADAANSLSEVVVTATRTETTLQKTPVAVTVHSAVDLQKADVHNLFALQQMDTSVNITQSTGSAYIAIRGVTSTNVTEVGNPAVSLARDGFFTNRSYSIGTSFYDLARIEVLKGPQGTLFGRNSTGGLINIITQEPGRTFGGYVIGTVGDYKLFGGEGAVNVPVTDQFAVRVSGYGRSRDGYRHVTGANGLDYRGDDDKTASGRIQAMWRPIEQFDALLSYQQDQIRGHGDVAKIGFLGVPFSGDAKSLTGYVPSVVHLDDGRTRWVANLHGLPFGATLTYAGGLDVVDYHHELDASQVPATGPAIPAHFVQNEHPKTWNHEVRIATPADQPLTAQFGGFYFYEHNNPLISFLHNEGGPNAGLNTIIFHYNVKTVSKALFGQVGYLIMPNLRITGGMRYTWDKVTRLGSSDLRCDIAGIPPFLYGALGCRGTPPILHNAVNGQTSGEKPTFHVGAEWNPTDTNMLYAKYDTGYKSGGFNTNPNAASVPYAEEQVKTIEVGTKNRFLDRRLTLNVDVFHQRYTGYQANVPTTLVSGGTGILNIGSASIDGAEIELQALLDPATRLDAGATFLHAKFGQGLPKVAPLQSTLPPVDISGHDLPNAPHAVITAGIEHDLDVGSGKLTGRLDGKYSSKFFYDLYNFVDTTSPSYIMGNVSLTYVPAKGNWQALVYVRNFTDQVILARAAQNGNSLTDNFQFQAPRTFGAQVTLRF